MEGTEAKPAIAALSILGNVYKVAFWTLAYIVYETPLLERIRIELESAVRDDRQVDEPHLAQHCPLLESLIGEVSRLTVASSLGRDVVTPTLVRDKILQPGNKLLVCAVVEHPHEGYLSGHSWHHLTIAIGQIKLVPHPPATPRFLGLGS